MIDDTSRIAYGGPKLCDCGCGQPAPLAVLTNRRTGTIKGQPQRFVSGHHLKRVAATKRIELTGQRFGRLTALRLTRLGKSMWELKCDCGTVVHARSENLRSGKVTSCGATTCGPRVSSARARRSTDAPRTTTGNPLPLHKLGSKRLFEGLALHVYGAFHAGSICSKTSSFRATPCLETEKNGWPESC